MSNNFLRTINSLSDYFDHLLTNIVNTLVGIH